MRVFLSVLLACFALAPLAGADEATAKELERMIMAPCCGKGTVADHPSPASDRVRREVREMLATGMGRQAILDHYVAEYGETILSMPPAKGFNLIVYWVPFFAFIAGLPLIYLALRAWRHHAPAIAEPAVAAGAGAPAPPVEEDARYEERLRRQLANLD